MNITLKDIIEYTAAALGFLCYRRGPVSGPEFAQMIRRYYDNTKATICADVVEKHITSIEYNGVNTKTHYKL